MNGQAMVLASANFDLWLFDDGTDDEIRRVRLDDLLAERIEKARNDRDLGPEQVRKLRLAGNGDIKRLFDRVAEHRVGFEAARLDYDAGRAALAKLEPLGREFRLGPFHAESLFAKTLRKIDDDDRAARFGTK